MTTRKLVLEASAVTKFYTATDGKNIIPVLKNVDLEVADGEFIAIVGPSGSGKSTLLSCLAGLESVSSGSVRALSNDISKLRGNALARFRRDHVGFIFQSYNLIPSLTVVENVALPGMLTRRRLALREAKLALSNVEMSEYENSFPQRLSGGQQQRVAIARAVASGAELIFADEPTGALDMKNGQLILKLLRQASDEKNRAVIMVTHDLNAASRADQVLVLRDGVVEARLVNVTSEEILKALNSSSVSSVIDDN